MLILIALFLVSIPSSNSSSVPFPEPDSERWGWDGHKIICAIAWWEMNDTTREEVRGLITRDSEFDRFMESCLWADQVRGQDQQYDRFTTAHYVNLPRGTEAFDLERDCGATYCIVEAITDMQKQLKEAPGGSAQALEALKFLAHFVGDIHQPLHAGYGDDRGGNSTRITAWGEEANLHGLWDYGLIERRGREWLDYASYLYFGISEEDRAAWQSLEPSVWVEESFAVVVASAYDLPENAVVGDAYYDRHIGIVETRLQQAGIRLARMLEGSL